jgi:hypothetical protein
MVDMDSRFQIMAKTKLEAVERDQELWLGSQTLGRIISKRSRV